MVAHFTLRTHEGKSVFSGKNIQFVSAPDVIKRLEQRMRLKPSFKRHEEKWVILGKNTRFDDSFDVTKCLQQIEKPDLLHVCA